jgi:hypothetical protein
MVGVKRLAGAAALALLAVGCAGKPTPYQPISSSSRVAGGYSETRLAADHFRVTFIGNSFTSRERVEASLLYRAAELTLAEGYDWFVIEDREVEHQVERDLRPDPLYRPWFYDNYGYWRPYWRYFGPRTGWRTWDPYFGDPFWADRIDTRTIERFEVSAEIRMNRGALQPSNRKAFDARDVIARIGPQIRDPR